MRRLGRHFINIGDSSRAGAARPVFFLSFLQKKFISMSFNFNLKNRFVSRVIIIGVKITRLDTNINNAEILLSHNNMAPT